MAEVEAIGKVAKVHVNKFGFWLINVIDDENTWHNNISLGTKKEPQKVKSGVRVKVVYDPDNYSNLVDKQLEVLESSPAQSSGGSGKPAAGGKKFVDNSIGMGVGAALNNTVQLFIGGKIEESDFPTVMTNLYNLSEGAKAAATDGKLEEFMETEFHLLPEEASKEAPKKRTTRKPAAKKQAKPDPEPETDDDFPDDDIPF